jgi:uncharacterized coiled-coil protein SlyX
MPLLHPSIFFSIHNVFLFDIYFSKEIMVRELQTALEDSKKAVDNAEERLVRKDEKIINLESEKQEHQGTENIPPVGRLCPPFFYNSVHNIFPHWHSSTVCFGCWRVFQSK